MRSGFILAVVVSQSFPFALPLSAQQAQVRVDDRVELIAIVNRLAGREEYNLTRVPRWASSVDDYFARFRDHPAVAMTRRLRFGFFIPMNLAAHLSPPPALAERSPFAASATLHRRWAMYPDSTRAYVELLRAFARETRFDAFMAAHRPLVDSASVRLRRVVQGIDQQWIERFWGRAAPMAFVVVAGLTNGGASYAQEFASPNGQAEAWAVVGVGGADSTGMPSYDAGDAATVLHEMNHPYVTPIVRQYGDRIRPVAESLFVRVARDMRAQGYGTWESMINESIVRAAVPRYYLAHGDSLKANEEIDSQERLGFVWTRELVALLGQYERDRVRYASFDLFMPQVVEFFSRQAQARP
jgi:hypothetical protein